MEGDNLVVVVIMVMVTDNDDVARNLMLILIHECCISETQSKQFKKMRENASVSSIKYAN